MDRKIDRREFLKAVGIGAAAVTFGGCGAVKKAGVCSRRRELPNFVIIFTDDQGYADVGCYGAEGFQTPNLDRMAAEGMRFTDFYVGAPVCTPSRAALLTGCYPQRVGLPYVIGTRSKIGISDKETTIAQMLKQCGYATACYGKWHLGYQKRFLPTHHGFDDYFGLPYSNDMSTPIPTKKGRMGLPLIEGDKIISYEPDQNQLTTWYTEHAVQFIEKNRDKPFFVYLAHSMPHVPLHVSDKFRGKTKRGLYGDVIMEIDWSVGQVLSTLKRLCIDERTLVIFTSDNGPWLRYGDHAGSAKPLREGKGTTFDGGQREACIMRWPGRIPAGAVCREVATTMDILPTFAAFAGAKLPANKIDGKDVRALMSGRAGAKSPHKAIFYYNGWRLEAVRSGKWKLHFPHRYNTLGGRKGGTGGKAVNYEQRKIALSLFDLDNDIGEKHNVAAEHPDIVKRLSELGRKIALQLGDQANKVKGSEMRSPGHV